MKHTCLGRWYGPVFLHSFACFAELGIIPSLPEPAQYQDMTQADRHGWVVAMGTWIWQR